MQAWCYANACQGIPCSGKAILVMDAVLVFARAIAGAPDVTDAAAARRAAISLCETKIYLKKKMCMCGERGDAVLVYASAIPVHPVPRFWYASPIASTSTVLKKIKIPSKALTVTQFMLAPTCCFYHNLGQPELTVFS